MTMAIRKSHSPNPCVSLQDLTESELSTFKSINSTVLPNQYSPIWYRDSIKVGQLAKLAYFTSTSTSIKEAVGGIRCAIDYSDPNQPKIYIMTLAVLAPYREYGIATLLLEHIAQQAIIQGISQVYVHTWTKNEDAIEWYQNRGFIKDQEVVKGYYKKMRPVGDAYILTLNVL